jgi:Transposase DDE domain group 1
VKNIGLYPRVQADTSGTGVVSQAGALALVETVRVAGLDAGLSAALSGWRKPLARHDPAKVITDLAVTLALGGDCLSDVALLRAEPSVFGAVASDPTVSRTIDALAADASRALRAIDSARAKARAAVWSAAGEHAPDHGASADAPVVIDLDATLITAHSEKELAAPTYKRGFGFHPLWSFADHGAQGTGEPLSCLLRPGNAGSVRHEVALVKWMHRLEVG